MLQSSLRTLQKKNIALKMAKEEWNNGDSIDCFCEKLCISRGTFFNYYGNTDNLNYTKLVMAILEPDTISMTLDLLNTWLRYMIVKPELTYIAGLTYIYSKEDVKRAVVLLDKQYFVENLLLLI